MKKISLILLSIIFISGQLNASFLPQTSAYSMLPEGRTVDDLATKWQPPVRAVNILGGPIAATDKEGNKCYYTSKGRMAVSFNKDGKATFSLGGVSIMKDSDGNTTGYSKQVKGTNLIEVTNEFGEVLSYKELGFGGKIVATYDKDKNLTSTFNYNKYGKGLDSIKNEMTQSLTVYGGTTDVPLYELDVDGNRLTKYIYDEYGRLSEKVDLYGNITHYDKRGAATYAETKEGVVIAKYNYKYDTEGNYVLESVLDPATRAVTYFDAYGRQSVTKNYAGAVTTDFLWRGSTLVATFNRENQETTWYDIDGKALYTSFNDQVVNKNLYFKGQLVGIWDVRSNQITVLQNERRELVVQWGDPATGATELTTMVRCSMDDGSSIVLGLEDFKRSELGSLYSKVEEFSAYVLQSDENGNIIDYSPIIEPTAELIRKWIDDGLIDKKYLFSSL